MKETVDPRTSTITIEFDMNIKEDQEYYHRVRDTLSHAVFGNSLPETKYSPARTPRVSLANPLLPEVEKTEGEPSAETFIPSHVHEIRELQEKVRQLEMENFNLSASASGLRARIEESRYEV